MQKSLSSQNDILHVLLLGEESQEMSLQMWLAEIKGFFLCLAAFLASYWPGWLVVLSTMISLRDCLTGEAERCTKSLKLFIWTPDGEVVSRGQWGEEGFRFWGGNKFVHHVYLHPTMACLQTEIQAKVCHSDWNTATNNNGYKEDRAHMIITIWKLFLFSVEFLGQCSVDGYVCSNEWGHFLGC